MFKKRLILAAGLAALVALPAATQAEITPEEVARLSQDLTPFGAIRAGNEDGSVPPEVARATADLIPGARFELIDDAGHLPCVEHPDEYARILVEFMRDHGHV